MKEEKVLTKHEIHKIANTVNECMDIYAKQECIELLEFMWKENIRPSLSMKTPFFISADGNSAFTSPEKMYDFFNLNKSK